MFLSPLKKGDGVTPFNCSQRTDCSNCDVESFYNPISTHAVADALSESNAVKRILFRRVPNGGQDPTTYRCSRAAAGFK